MIRFAKPDDAPKIMKFIDDHWKKNHILARDEAFFRYFYQNGNELNFVISEETADSINATLAFVSYSKVNRDVMLCMWKAIHTADPTLGMKLLDFLRINGDVNIMASPGINKKVIPIYQYFGYTTGKMKHWYRLAQNHDYKIAVIKDNTISALEQSAVQWRRFPTFDEMTDFFDAEKYKNSSPKPYKENWYIKKRYFDHPVYKYHAFGIIREGGTAHAIFFYRMQEFNNSCAIRLVDCIGDYNDFAEIGKILDSLLEYHNAEYVDLYEAGLSSNLLLRGGFKNVDETENIIPDYFAPYEPRNVDIYYCSTEPKIVLFKGDGDQDRPN